MEFVVQFIREILLVAPGGFIRWLWVGRDKSFFKFIQEDESIYNYILSFLIIICIVSLIVLL